MLDLFSNKYGSFNYQLLIHRKNVKKRIYNQPRHLPRSEQTRNGPKFHANAAAMPLSVEPPFLSCFVCGFLRFFFRHYCWRPRRDTLVIGGLAALSSFPRPVCEATIGPCARCPGKRADARTLLAAVRDDARFFLSGGLRRWHQPDSLRHRLLFAAPLLFCLTVYHLFVRLSAHST